MSFNVSYNFVALNQFSGTAAKISKSAKNVSKSIKPIGKNLVSLKKNSKVATQSIRTDLIKTATVGGASFNKINKSTTGFRTALKKIKAIRPFKKIQSGVSKLRRSMRSLRKDTTGAGRSLAGAFKGFIVGAGLFIAARKFVTVGGDFQDSLADLSAITGATGKDFALLSTETLRLAKNSAIAQTEVAEAIKVVGSQKSELLKNIPALIGVTEKVLLLKNAAGIELSDAANIATQSMNIFGASADKAGKFVDILAAASVVGASEIADTGEAIIIAGGAARSAGLNFKDLNTLIQVTSKGGFKGARAGTALSAIFGRLQRGKKGVFGGIDFEKTDLQSIFVGIKKQLDAMPNSVARAQLATELFGEEHQKVGFALLNNATLINKFSKAIGESGIAQKQADLRLATFNAKMRKLGVIIKDRVIRVFNRLEPVLTNLAIRFGDFIDSITPEQLNNFGDSLKIFVEDATKIGETIGKILKSAFTAENIKQFRTELGQTLDTLNLMVKPLKFFASIFKGTGTAIGEFVGEVVTLDFAGKNATTSFKDAFSVGGDLFGVLENAKPTINNVIDFPKPNITLPPPTESPSVTSPEDSRSTVDININAPAGVVKDIKTNRTGNSKKLNVGVNMKEAS